MELTKVRYIQIIVIVLLIAVVVFFLFFHNSKETACGDDSCDSKETCSTCPEDCGACPIAGSICGDGECTENCTTCSQDCGECLPEPEPPQDVLIYQEAVRTRNLTKCGEIATEEFREACTSMLQT